MSAEEIEAIVADALAGDADAHAAIEEAAAPSARGSPTFTPPTDPFAVALISWSRLFSTEPRHSYAIADAHFGLPIYPIAWGTAPLLVAGISTVIVFGMCARVLSHSRPYVWPATSNLMVDRPSAGRRQSEHRAIIELAMDGVH